MVIFRLRGLSWRNCWADGVKSELSSWGVWSNICQPPALLEFAKAAPRRNWKSEPAATEEITSWQKQTVRMTHPQQYATRTDAIKTNQANQCDISAFSQAPVRHHCTIGKLCSFAVQQKSRLLCGNSRHTHTACPSCLQRNWTHSWAKMLNEYSYELSRFFLPLCTQ